MTEKQYKPFDLERALAGDKFARKHDLKEPQEWHHFKTLDDTHGMRVIFDHKIFAYRSDGKFYSGLECAHDLVMLPKTKKIWIAVNKNHIIASETCFVTMNAYTTKLELENRMNFLGNNFKDYNIIEIEVEE